MKGFITKVLACALTSTFAFSAIGQELVGDKANYKLDRDRKRTTSLIKRGTVSAEVLSHLPNDPDGPAYLTKMDYNLRVSFIGNKKGSVELKAPEEFFTKEFMERLRKEGEIITPKFTVKHVGQGKAETSSGRVFEDSDIIEIFDVDTSTANTFSFIGFAYSVPTWVYPKQHSLDLCRFISTVAGLARLKDTFL